MFKPFIPLEWKMGQSIFFLWKTKFLPKCSVTENCMRHWNSSIWEITLGNWVKNIWVYISFNCSLLRNVSIILLKSAWFWIPLLRSPECKCDHIHHCLTYLLRCFFSKWREWMILIFDSLYSTKDMTFFSREDHPGLLTHEQYWKVLFDLHNSII